MHHTRVLDGARQTIFCPSAVGLGCLRAKLEFKGTPKAFTSPLLLPLQGLLRKNINSKPKFMGILALGEGAFAPPTGFARQEEEAPSAAPSLPALALSLHVCENLFPSGLLKIREKHPDTHPMRTRDDTDGSVLPPQAARRAG